MDLEEKIINEIENENNDYLNTLNKKLDNFLNENKDYLSSLITDLNIIFSKESLNNLTNSYERDLENYLNKILNIIINNSNLTNIYFDGLRAIMENDTEIVELLKYYIKIDKSIPSNLKCEDSEKCWKFIKFEDNIYSKRITKGYLNRYNIFKESFYYSKDYINQDLLSNLITEYKNIIIKFRTLLQTIKNIKINENYPDIYKLDFIENHKKDIDILFKRLDECVSDEIFNNKFLTKINNYKIEKNLEINNINKYIEDQHKRINSEEISNHEIINDFCVNFLRTKHYTCTNKNIYYVTGSNFTCFSTYGKDNYNNLLKPSFGSDVFSLFKNDFNEFYLLVKDKIDSYNEKINELKNILTSKEGTNSKEEKSINLIQFENKINSLISEKYGDNLINASYYFYKNNIDENLEIILSNITSKWNNAFDKLGKAVKNNLSNLKNSNFEFYLISSLYGVLISKNITRDFYNSIEEQQKNEFNYTISFYYNCLIKEITASFKYILNKIPTNPQGLNNMINIRKREIIEILEKILTNIKNLKNESLSIDKQTNLLKISFNNFFNLNETLQKNINQAQSEFNNYINKLLFLQNNKKDDECSFSSRLYSEISINSRHIQEFFKPIDDGIFIDLGLEKFKEIIKDNWFYNQYELINLLNISIYNSEKEIINEFSIEKEKYKKILEDEITKHYTKDALIQKINNLYINGIQEIDYKKREQIHENITKILNVIKNHLSNEKKKLNISLLYNCTKINKTIHEYKENVINKLKSELYNIVDNLYLEINRDFYEFYIEQGLDSFLMETIEHNLNSEIYSSLNSSYNIREIINDTVSSLVNDYKALSKKQIYYKKNEYIIKVNNESGFSEIKKIFEDEIEKGFDDFTKDLEKIEMQNTGETEYIEYDFNEDIKNEIELSIEDGISNIKNLLKEIKLDLEKNKREWDIMDFSLISFDIKKINLKFEAFISPQINYQKKTFEEFISDMFHNNFNNSLNDVIMSFGNIFFERILNYNENYKI